MNGKELDLALNLHKFTIGLSYVHSRSLMSDCFIHFEPVLLWGCNHCLKGNRHFISLAVDLNSNQWIWWLFCTVLMHWDLSVFLYHRHYCGAAPRLKCPRDTYKMQTCQLACNLCNKYAIWHLSTLMRIAPLNYTKSCRCEFYGKCECAVWQHDAAA